MTEKKHASLAISALESEDGHALPPRGREWKRAKIVMWVVLALLALGALRTVVSDVAQNRAVEAATRRNAVAYVNVVTPTRSDAAGVTTLPGTLRGYVESPIYARATGYLLHWYVDIGAHVKKGQLLADLDTPEIDQELSQAVAQRQQVIATLGLAKTTYDRAVKLRQRDAVSQQELDDREGAYNEDVANLDAANANVKRLEQLEVFKHIVAPFDGVITQRNVDVGDLIDAGSGTSRALFALAQTDPLRVYVLLPQAYAQNVKVGQQVVVTQPELPGRQFIATITHIAGAIDVATRSLQIEARLPNPDGVLRPGAYVQVAVPTRALASVRVPGNALLFRAEGPRLAVVDDHGIVHLHKVVIAQDLGQTLEIESGVTTHDRVIINPSDSIADGDHVQIEPAADSGKGAS
jgi:RND family efflux transporter MFP subunit